MRFEHGSHRTECLAALIVPLLLLLCCRCSYSSDDRRPPFGTELLRRQCLPLDEGVEPWEACGDRGRHHVRLRFCSAYEPARLLTDCDRRGLDNLLQLDEKARRLATQFGRIIDRYDCENANSVSWTCRDCEEAYKQWVCAMFLPPVQVEGEVACLKPCRYVCRLVEQRCPYFHPSVKEQYAGERVFKCIDPDIPDLNSVSSYGPPHRCYCPKHLDAGTDTGEPECQLLSPAQLRRNASRWGQHRSQAPPLLWGPSTPLLLLATALLVAAWWTTRTR